MAQQSKKTHEPADKNASARPRKRRRKHSAGAKIGFALLYVIMVIGVSVLLACVGWIAANDVLALNKDEKAVTVTITADQTFDDVTAMLKEKGLIEYEMLFKLFANVTKATGKVSPGTFTLNTDMDYRALISGMSKNSATRAKINVTIPEGYTLAQIFALLEEKGVATVSELEHEAATHAYDFSFLKDLPMGSATRLEGYLYPDTYEFYTPTNPVLAINKMLVNFDARFTDAMREEVAASEKTIHEILTIAGMIEKETDGTDRAKIASVIYNRLNNPDYETAGFLQIDATIYYVTGRTVTQNDRDTLTSPYNTFRYKGLPPGPIANPGLESIKAAMNPAKEKMYYYALGDDGLHHYFKTYAELDAFIRSQALYK